jgi:hypothetical protein
MHVRIVQDGELIADLPDWTEAIPAVGDYLFHPPPASEPAGATPAGGIAGCVKVRTWRMYDRPAHRLAGEMPGFRQAAEPYVELAI